MYALLFVIWGFVLTPLDRYIYNSCTTQLPLALLPLTLEPPPHLTSKHHLPLLPLLIPLLSKDLHRDSPQIPLPHLFNHPTPIVEKVLESPIASRSRKSYRSPVPYSRRRTSNYSAEIPTRSSLSMNASLMT